MAISRPNLASTNLQTGHDRYLTTVDAANQQKFQTVAVAGTKRLSDGLTYVEDRFTDSNQRAQFAYQPVQPINKLVASKIQRNGFSASQKDAVCLSDDIQLRSTPTPSQHPLLSLAHPRYDLSPQLVSNFGLLGVHSIYPWQSSCLLGKGCLEGRQNLIYTAPTGGGKSLVADVLMLKHVISNPDKKAVLVLPYVALVQEKTKWLRRVVEGVQKHIDQNTSDAANLPWNLPSADIRIVSFFGGSKSKAMWRDCDIAVCTIEKANSLVNLAIEDGTISELGVVVLDELHMLDDEHRGYIMELMLTKLMSLQSHIQIIGMSATLSNPKLLADWLQAKFYVSKYRPIPVEEHLVYDNCIYPTSDSHEFFHTASQLKRSAPTQRPQTASHTIAASLHPELKNPSLNAVVALAIDTAVSGFGALVFCSSRLGTQATAVLISEAMPSELISNEARIYRIDLLASLHALPGGFEGDLLKTIPHGVAFHHAGLTVEERDLLADAYDSGVLKVIVATCSLAAGINLPARRVILNGAKMGRDLVGPAMLRQMRGRAGRKGKDEVGETFLCCQKEELEPVAELLEAELPPVISCLVPERRGVKRAILEVIATRLASSYESLHQYIGRSLLWQTTDHRIVLDMLHAALSSLVEEGLIQKETEDAYTPTLLGSAIVASSLMPEDGLFVHSDLRRALSSFVMDSELHILYLFTPIPHASPGTLLTSDISWTVFRNIVDTLDEPSLRVLHLIGVSPALVNQMANSGLSDLKETTPDQITSARIYRRIYSTFALRDLCNESAIHTISLKYSLPRGAIQNLAQSCHGFAAGMIKFCQRMATPFTPSFPTSTQQPLHPPPQIQTHSHNTTTPDPQSAGFSMLATVLEHMQDRLRAGSRPDLLDMARVPFVKGRMARLLYENGFKGLRALAEADPRRDIMPVMMSVHRVVPRFGETAGEFEERRRRVEEKVGGKADVVVRVAGRLWERECVGAVMMEEE